MPGRKYTVNSSYRYGFNGKENDKDAGEGVQDYGMRIYDVRLGRFFSVDPLASEYPWNSTYAFAENDPINYIDLDGLEKPPLKSTENIGMRVRPLIEILKVGMKIFSKITKSPTSIIKDGFIKSNDITQHRIPKLESGKALKEKKYIILHRTVSSNTESTLTSFGTGVGTHFLVGKDGQILQTATLDESTSHLREKGKGAVYDKSPQAPHNINSIGIEVVGMPVDKDGKSTLVNKDIVGWQPLTPEQVTAVSSLVKTLKKEFNIPDESIKTHEGVQPKTKGEGQTVKDAIKNN